MAMKGMCYTKMAQLLLEAIKTMRQEFQDKFEEKDSEFASLKQELAEIKALLKVQVSSMPEE